MPRGWLLGSHPRGAILVISSATEDACVVMVRYGCREGSRGKDPIWWMQIGIYKYAFINMHL